MVGEVLVAPKDFILAIYRSGYAPIALTTSIVDPKRA